MRLFASIVLLSLLVAAPTHGSDVVQLTSANFKKQVLDSSQFWLVEFYAPWCGHCKNLAPTWKQLASDVKRVARIGAVDATEHKDLASQYGIQGFPTIKAFGRDKSQPEDYKGARDIKALSSYVREHAKGFSAPAKVQSVKYKDMHAYATSQAQRPRFLLLSQQRSAAKKSKWFHKIAGKAQQRFKDMQFGVAHGTHASKILQRLQLEDNAPHVVGIATDGTFDAVAVHDKRAAAAFIKSFVRQGPADPRPLPAFPERSRPKQRAPVKLVKLTPENLERKCLLAKGMCVVLLGASEDDMSSVARPLAKAFRLDSFSFGFVSPGAFQDSLASAMGLQGDSFAVVLKLGRRKRLAEFPRTDEQLAGVTSFLNDVVGGAVSFRRFDASELQALPQEPRVTTTSPSDDSNAEHIEL